MKNILSTAAMVLMTAGTIKAQSNEPKSFPLVVEFVSHCCGVPDNKPILDYAKCFKKKSKMPSVTAYKVGPAGREGEYYLVFLLEEFNDNNKAKFIKDIECITIKPGDKGGINYHKNFEIDSSRFSKPLLSDANAIRI